MIVASSFFDHVLDSDHWHLFETIPLGFQLPYPLTKFVVLQVIAAGLIAFLFIRLAKRVKDGQPPRGWGWNALEALLLFVRDEVARPCIGEHDADRYLPILWTLFLYILVNNLLGIVPFMGSATGNILVTGMLALCAFALIHGAAIVKHGPVHYLQSYVPHLEVPGGKIPGLLLGLFIAGIEIFGHFIKAFVLAVRLFANIFAGHTVLAVIMSFIVIAGNAGVHGALFWPISFGSTLFIVGLSLLEMFVAFLQAYVFVFLTSLFLGSTLHPEH